MILYSDFGQALHTWTTVVLGLVILLFWPFCVKTDHVVNMGSLCTFAWLAWATYSAGGYWIINGKNLPTFPIALLKQKNMWPLIVLLLPCFIFYLMYAGIYLLCTRRRNEPQEMHITLAHAEQTDDEMLTLPDDHLRDMHKAKDDWQPQRSSGATLWYCVRSSDRVRGVWLKKIREAGIEAKLLEIQIPVNGMGIVFPAEDWQHVFEALGIKPINIQRLFTNIDNVMYFSFEQPSGRLRVHWKRFHARRNTAAMEFVATLQNIMHAVLEAKKNEVVKKNKEIQAASETIALATRDSIVLEHEITQITKTTTSGHYALEQLLFQFRQIELMEHVIAITVSLNVIHVFTDMVYIEHDGKFFPIGEFEICVHLSGAITWKNLTRKNGAAHPYRDCLGNTQTAIAKMIGRGEIADAIQVILELLRTVHGQYVSYLINEWEPVERKVM